MRNRVLRRATMSAAALVFAVTAVAYADVINADGDNVLPSAQTFIDLGTVGSGATITYNVYFLLECRGTAHALPGSTISLTPRVLAVAPGGSMAATPTTIGPVPATWPGAGEACLGDPVFQSTTASVVTIVAPTVADTGYTYRVEYLKAPLTGISGTSTMTFRLNVSTNTAPVVTPMVDQIAEANTLGGWLSSYSATATDAEDGPLAAPCVPASGSVLPVGQTIVVCTATDSAGATGSTSFRMNVTDTTPPALSGVPAGVTGETPDPAGANVSWPAPSAVDIVDGSVSVNCAPASGSLFPVGSTTVDCSATDAAGNVATASFSVDVTLFDITPPVLSGVPADISTDTPDPSGTIVTWTAPSAVDNIDGPVAVTCTPASGSRFAIGTTRVTCSASDAAGNSTSRSFDVTVTLTVSGGGDNVTAAWEPPFNGSSPFMANGRGTLPLKGQFTIAGVGVLPPAAPRLILERLTACDGTVVERLDGGAFDWAGDRWITQLRTGLLTPGCWRASVAVGGSEGGSMMLLVGHGTDSTTSGTGKAGTKSKAAP